jgi:hypothetical protein
MKKDKMGNLGGGGANMVGREEKYMQGFGGEK